MHLIAINRKIKSLSLCTKNNYKEELSDFQEILSNWILVSSSQTAYSGLSKLLLIVIKLQKQTEVGHEIALDYPCS